MKKVVVDWVIIGGMMWMLNLVMVVLLRMDVE